MQPLNSVFNVVLRKMENCRMDIIISYYAAMMLPTPQHTVPSYKKTPSIIQILNFQSIDEYMSRL
jgi:hypothetical protein